jgi:hypothetical protein
MRTPSSSSSSSSSSVRIKENLRRRGFVRHVAVMCLLFVALVSCFTMAKTTGARCLGNLFSTLRQDNTKQETAEVCSGLIVLWFAVTTSMFSYLVGGLCNVSQVPDWMVAGWSSGMTLVLFLWLAADQHPPPSVTAWIWELVVAGVGTGVVVFAWVALGLCLKIFGSPMSRWLTSVGSGAMQCVEWTCRRGRRRLQVGSRSSRVRQTPIHWDTSHHHRTYPRDVYNHLDTPLSNSSIKFVIPETRSPSNWFFQKRQQSSVEPW